VQSATLSYSTIQVCQDDYHYAVWAPLSFVVSNPHFDLFYIWYIHTGILFFF
jgi:hypothetical protein